MKRRQLSIRQARDERHELVRDIRDLLTVLVYQQELTDLFKDGFLEVDRDAARWSQCRREPDGEE